jgi:peroxiredoxin
MTRITALGVAAVCVLALAAPASADGVATGDNAPAFSVKDSNGKTHALSDYRGKYVVLEWVNFGCPFVKKHYNSENMQKLQKEWAAKEVVWLTVCSSGVGQQGHMAADQINAALVSKGAKPKAYLADESGEMGRAYGAKTTPHMFVIDPKGKVIYQGAIDSIRSANPADIDKATPYVSQALAASMKGETVPNATTQPYGCGVKYGK